MPTIKKTQVEFEGRIEEREVIVEEQNAEAWGPDAQLAIVGKPTPRIDGAERVTGRARYTHDMFQAGTLTGRFLRSPYPHARLISIDSSAAEALPGVVLVWHRDQPPPIVQFEGRDVFASELAYEGAEVAFVVATNPRTAEDAVAAMQVSYEELPFVHSITAAEAEQAAPALLDLADNHIDPGGSVYNRGSMQAGLLAADVVVDLTFETPPAAHCCLETHGSVVAWEGDQVTVWHSTQSVFGARNSLADALGIARHKVHAICSFVGGGFGSKFAVEVYTLLAALAARQTGHPVGALLDRQEEHLVAGYRPPSRQRVRLGATKDGKLTLIEHEAWAATGAYGGRAPVIGGPAKDLYACPNARTAAWALRVNTDASRAFRAPGYVEGTFALEGALDELALRLEIDPLELRQINYAEISPSRGIPYTTKGLAQAYAMGAQAIGWAQRKQHPRQQGVWRRGWGMASQIWGGGGGPPAKALIKLLPDATCEVCVGVQDLGTGTKTVLAQVAAEALGLPLDNIRVVIGDSQATPFGPGSGGSVTLASTTPAVREAAYDTLRQLFDLASYMLGLEDGQSSELVARGGEIIYLPDPDRRLRFIDVTAKMGNYMIVGQGARGPNPDGKAINTFGAHFCQVLVNPQTGQIRVEKVVAAQEFGRVVNPLTATSQVYGGVTMALGYALSEQRILDPRFGLQLTTNLEDYKPPSIADIPEIEVLFVDQADPEANSVGSKGLGEPPIIPLAAALVNAVADAIGVRITRLPLTPDRVLAALGGKQEIAP